VTVNEWSLHVPKIFFSFTVCEYYLCSCLYLNKARIQRRQFTHQKIKGVKNTGSDPYTISALSEPYWLLLLI